MNLYGPNDVYILNCLLLFFGVTYAHSHFKGETALLLKCIHKKIDIQTFCD